MTKLSNNGIIKYKEKEMICKIDEHPSFEKSTQDYTGKIPSSAFFMFMNHNKYINNLSVDIVFDSCIKLNN